MARRSASLSAICNGPILDHSGNGGSNRHNGGGLRNHFQDSTSGISAIPSNINNFVGFDVVGNYRWLHELHLCGKHHQTTSPADVYPCFQNCLEADNHFWPQPSDPSACISGSLAPFVMEFGFVHPRIGPSSCECSVDGLPASDAQREIPRHSTGYCFCDDDPLLRQPSYVATIPYSLRYGSHFARPKPDVSPTPSDEASDFGAGTNVRELGFGNYFCHCWLGRSGFGHKEIPKPDCLLGIKDGKN